ncbi:hypothetical protein [Paenibacillus hamazuiensis]|uniref:hypothetical protein n=1 Tax=Paenibacillus hamazuiensis TaxID=2936508 RepID=UPI00200E66E0|nr:hypothetical protein [Paenibacillus hamazuiensis]
MIVCTVTSAANLIKAQIMARSVKEHHPDAKVVVCLVEERLHSAAICPFIDEIVLARQTGVPDFYRRMFKYNVNEGTTSMKPDLLRYAMKRYADERDFVYLDSDMKVYAPLTDLLNALRRHSLVLTPHLVSTQLNDTVYLQVGIYNTGIVAMTRSEETVRFLGWWAQRLYRYSYYDDLFFADQKWLDLAPGFFDVHVFGHPGYNMAYWNLHETARSLRRLPDGRYVLAGGPLAVFHFSHAETDLQQYMAAFFPDRGSAIYSLVDSYLEEFTRAGGRVLSMTPWSYDFFSSGEPILTQVRKKYAIDPELAGLYPNPFTASNAALNP